MLSGSSLVVSHMRLNRRRLANVKGLMGVILLYTSCVISLSLLVLLFEGFFHGVCLYQRASPCFSFCVVAVSAPVPT